MVRKVVIAIDSSQPAEKALLYTVANIVHASDEIHLVSVTPPVSQSYPVVPVATGAAVTAALHQMELQGKACEHEAEALLQHAVKLILETRKNIPHDDIKTHVLPAAGGASGVAESITMFVQVHHADLLAVGSRGMGAVQRSLMSVLGLGSVSDYCISNAASPVLVVRGAEDFHLRQEATVHHAELSFKRVMLATDDSPHSQRALVWAIEHLIHKGHDHLHVVSVAQSVPFPIMDEVTAVAMEAQMAHEGAERSLQYAKQVAEKCGEMAVARGMLKTKVTSAVLSPEGGASDIGAALCSYAKDKSIDVMVVGRRGLGGLQRSLLSLVGLGSVSDYCAHHSPCPLVVLHQADLQHTLAATANLAGGDTIAEEGEEGLPLESDASLGPIREGDCEGVSFVVPKAAATADSAGK